MLTITPQAVARIARYSLQTHTTPESDPDVRVSHMGDEHLELSATVTLPYPTEPLGSVLDRLRAQVAQDVGAAVGRPVRSLDLTVDEFRTHPVAPRRRVL